MENLAEIQKSHKTERCNCWPSSLPQEDHSPPPPLQLIQMQIPVPNPHCMYIQSEDKESAFLSSPGLSLSFWKHRAT